jgi:hypothetical protein
MFNFWETKIGQNIDGYTSQIKMWMKAMLAITTAILVVVIIKLFKK